MQFSDKFNELKEEANANNINATGIVSEAFVSLVKLDHVAFKLNGYKEIFTHSGKKLSDHLSCRLGKWVATDGKQRFGTNPVFPLINEPHQKVHQSMNEAIELAKNIDESQNEQIEQEILSKCNDAETASGRLFDIFKDMLAIASDAQTKTTPQQDSSDPQEAQTNKEES
ncbi:CZB domain-containing protein [Campylobacter sp. MIT 97-5078]